MWKDAYDLDVALETVATMIGITVCKYDRETDPEKKQNLSEQLDMMYYERENLYKAGEPQRSVMDKAFRLYAPIIREYYATI
jgi:hypothetical protein